jgi:23S rRNA (pseudouridine1915-N3)-methyltransferase
MNILLIAVGKTDLNSISHLCEDYFKRIKRYINFEFKIIKDIKTTAKTNESIQKKLEGEKILSELSSSDFVVLLDEKAKEFTSREFASFLEKQMNMSTKNLIFVIGGAYGFSQEVYDRANLKFSLSQMTFSHQIIRIIFAEQLYRAFTIINNEPYHHD